MRYILIALAIVTSLVSQAVPVVSAAESCPQGQHIEVTHRRGGNVEDVKRTECAAGASQSLPSSSRQTSPAATPTPASSSKPTPSVVRTVTPTLVGVLVGFQPGTTRDRKNQIHAAVGASFVREIAQLNVDVVQVPQPAQATIDTYQSGRFPEVRYAEIDGQVGIEPVCLTQIVPRIQTTSVGAGVLQISLSTGRAQISELRFGRLDNAVVEIAGRVYTAGGFSVAIQDTSASFLVRRVQPGAAFNVQYTIVHECGQWSTFVGGGVNAP